jgi:hypothetical protein
MLARHWIMMGLLFSLPPVHAAEAEDTTLEIIEMLGESDDEIVDFEIAMSDINVKAGEKDALPQEVNDAE